jgi:hypothetical protein
MTVEESFNELLTREIRELTDILPEALLGGGPVSTLLFQPTSRGGRLVYLDEQVSPQDPICLDPSQEFGSRFLDPHYMAPWIMAKGKVTAKNAADYCERNTPQVRARLAAQDARRYKDIAFDDKTGTTAIGTSYQVHQIIPSPLFQESLEWWKRLPRLGQIYSLANLLEHENLLLICALRVGNRAQHVRLRMILDHPGRLGRTAYEIAQSAARDHDVDDDDYAFLISHLLLCHHWFFPFDPLALKAFAKLGCAPDDVLSTHGWPAAGLGTLSGGDDTELADLLIKDLAFLISACSDSIEPSSDASWDKLHRKLRDNLPMAMALICGQAVYVMAHGSDLKFHAESPAIPRHLCIQPLDLSKLFPQERQSPILPMFLHSQLSTQNKLSSRNSNQALDELNSAAEAYVRTLCPIDGASAKEWNLVQVTRIRGNKIVDKGQRMGKWVTEYARGRCALKVVKDMRDKRTAA